MGNWEQLNTKADRAIELLKAYSIASDDYIYAIGEFHQANESYEHSSGSQKQCDKALKSMNDKKEILRKLDEQAAELIELYTPEEIENE